MNRHKYIGDEYHKQDYESETGKSGLTKAGKPTQAYNNWRKEKRGLGPAK